MSQLTLQADSGSGEEADINLQNGNIYFLKQIYNLPFRNSNNDVIDVSHIAMIPNVTPHGMNMTYFNNSDNNTTRYVFVTIPDDAIDYTLDQLHFFKAQYPNIPFNTIVNDGANNDGTVVVNAPLNRVSILKAIELMWFRFGSDLVYENMHAVPNIVNSNHPNSHNYVNSTYQDYLWEYSYENAQQDLRYIHPVLFPVIFRIVFNNNLIPMSLYEASLPSNNAEIYNNTILQHNLQYIQNQNTILCINRNPLALQILNVMAIQQEHQNHQNNINMENNNNNPAMPTA